MDKRISVVILNWNGRGMMEKFLPSVVECSPSGEAEVIVVDNGSTDDSVEWLKTQYPQVRLIEFPENYGFAGGYDRAIRMIDAEYILLLNSDVEVTPGWFEPLVSFMDANPDAGAVQPKIRAFRNREYFEHAGAAGGLLDSLGYPYCRGRVMSKVEKDEGQYDSPEPVEITWASGAAMLVRRKAYLEAGGLDAGFFAHMEEIDLCWRMMLKGYKIFAVTESTVFHYGGGALPYGNPRKTYLNFRNGLLMLHKNLPEKVGRKVLFRRRLVDSVGFFFFILKGKFKDARAVLKAHNDFKKLKKQYTAFPTQNLLGTIPGSDKSIFFVK